MDKVRVWIRNCSPKRILFFLVFSLVCLWTSQMKGAPPISNEPIESDKRKHRKTREERLMAVLNLTAEQKRQWKVALAPLNKLAARRKEFTKERFGELLRQEGHATSRRIAGILNAAQAAAYRKFLLDEAADFAAVKERRRQNPPKRMNGTPKSLRRGKSQ